MTTTPVLCPAQHRDDAPRRAADGLVLCTSCRDRLERHLAELPALHRACERMLVPSGRANGAGPVSGTTEPSWAVSDAPAHAREVIRVELVAWTRVVLEEGPWQVAPPDTLTGMAAWLILRTDWMAARPWADEVARTIADTRNEAWRAAYPNPIKRVRVGECPEPGCEGELHAVVRDQDDLLPATILCDVAGRDPEDPHEWTPEEWRELRRRMAGYRRLAAQILGT